MPHSHTTRTPAPTAARLLSLIIVAALAVAALGLSGCCESGPPKTPYPQGSVPNTPSVEPSDEDSITTGMEGEGEDFDFGTFNQDTAGGTKTQLPGPVETTVPNVVGMSLSAAESKAEAAGLRLVKIPRPLASTWYNKVFQQNPKAGETAYTGEDLWVTYGHSK